MSAASIHPAFWRFTMRSRAVVISLAIYFSFALLACSKKAPENAPSSDTTSPTTTQNETGGSAAQNEKMGKAEKAEKAQATPKPLVVPAGTVLTVRLGQSLGSKISQPGETFSATVATPVEIDGKTVIPAGSAASGTVVDAKPLGRFKGGAALEVRLDSVNINGTDHPIQTSPLTRTAKGKGKRTAVMAGGGAGLGALIGGLAGGGKGAAIGALAGGGAGTAGAAFTGNKDIVLPAESAISFKLNQPLELK